MLSDDKYTEIAEFYDAMSPANAVREGFFHRQFQRYNVKRVLDCACGTGNDLLLFHTLGYSVCGSDISESMLAVARRKLLKKKIQIPLQLADFHSLRVHYSKKFDAVVCLSNAINESEVDIGNALNSMRSVLNYGGIIVFDQGQTDCSMKNPPRFVPIVNNRDISRLFVLDYAQTLMTVQVFDFVHNEKEKRYDFRQSEFKIRIRLLADWVAILNDLFRRHIFVPACMEYTAYTTAELAGAPEALAVVTAEELASTESLLTEGGLKTDGFITAFSQGSILVAGITHAVARIGRCKGVIC